MTKRINTSEPHVVRKWAQPVSEKQHGKNVNIPQTQIFKELLPSEEYPQTRYYGFVGHYQNGEQRSVAVLAGEGAPTVKGGWPKIAKVQRFQRLSITVPEGWEPMELVIPVQFESVVNFNNPKNLDKDIENLEWMAARTPHPPAGEIKGEPPYVEVYTVNSQGVQVPLVPKPYQGEPGRGQQYYLTNIEYDTGALRDAGGGVRRQKATVTLTEIVSSPSALLRNRKAREEVKGQYDKYKISKTVNTIRKVAKEVRHPDAWRAILEANENITHSADKVLKSGTIIKIPKTIFRQVPK